MKRRFAIVATVLAVLLLLGVGLCGVGAARQHRQPDEFFNGTELIGFLLCLVSGLSLTVAGVASIVAAAAKISWSAIADRTNDGSDLSIRPSESDTGGSSHRTSREPKL